MTGPASIRRLLPDDVGLLRNMSAMFGKAFDEMDSYTAAQPRDDYLRRLLAGENFIALAALKDRDVVGGLVAYEFVKFEQARSEIYIYDLAVDEAHRREGIATSLIETLKTIAGERGAWVIYVQADQGDEPAIALYSGLGEREDIHHFDIDVPGPR